MTRKEAPKERRPAEDEATRAAIAEGLAQARRAEFATDAEVAEAYAQFRRPPRGKPGPK